MPHHGTARHPRVLLAEDQFVIGMSLADELEAHGFEVAGTFASCAEALAWLAGHGPDVAILDIKLADGSSLELARELRRRDVPFVFFTGSQGTEHGLKAEFPDVPWVGKPASASTLIHVLEGLLERGAFRRPVAPVPAPDWAEAMAVARRRLIQDGLVWSGHYDGMIDGRFGPRTIRAIERFQSSLGHEPTGRLTEAEVEILGARAEAAKRDTGYGIHDDAATGLTMGLPLRLVPYAGPVSHGSRFVSSDGRIDIELLRFGPEENLRSLYRRLETSNPARQTTYSAVRDNWFVVTGLDDGREFYIRARQEPDGVAAFSTTWDRDIAETFEPVVVAMSNAFAAPAPALP